MVSNNLNTKGIEKAAEVLSKGGVVIFPTDTVWGVGVMADDNEAVSRLYSIKKREEDKPTAVLVDSLTTAWRLGIFNRKARELARSYWPGGLTIIVPARRESVSGLLLGKDGNIGLRIPDHRVTLAILDRLGRGVATGSANFSGEKAPSSYSEISRDLLKIVDYVVWPNRIGEKSEYEAGGHEPSTVVDTSSRPFKILRKGPVDVEIKSAREGE